MRTRRTIRSLPLLYERITSALSLERYNKRPSIILIFIEEQQIENLASYLVNNFYNTNSIVRDFGCKQIYKTHDSRNK